MGNILYVEVGGPAHLYAREMPAGAMAVGVVRLADGAVGALLRFRNGAYAQLDDQVFRALDRLEVLRAMTSALTPASADS
ncbi:MAG: hypothetical protein ACM3JC_06065 [Rudaea sp.]